MTVEQHLILRESILSPAAEWIPQYRGWTVVRVIEGAGYWMQGGKARELNVGDGFVTGFNPNALLRASRLGPLKLQFFTIQPQYLGGLLTVAESRQVEMASNNSSSHVSMFTADGPIGQNFARIAGQFKKNELPMRCALLQLWAGAIDGLLNVPAPDCGGGGKLRERIRELVGRMPEAEFLGCSISDLAAELSCSKRSFSRLFREEFGVSPHARQIEFRFQRACQLLADPEIKIIHVAYGSGYRHLGLFNAMFKKRFGATPREWRRQTLEKNTPSRSRNPFSKLAAAAVIFFVMTGLFLGSPASAQTNRVDSPAVAKARAALYEKMRELDKQEAESNIHFVPVSTNGPHFTVEKYLVAGNSILPPGTVGGVFTNVPAAFGTNVNFDAIRAALGDLEMAYHERGFVTVSIGLPQQKLTNATVKVQVTEGRLAAINVTGNRWYGTENVLRALPSLHTNMLLNSHVFQQELDTANASRDRQIYPVIGPGLEPGTTELTLKVKDQFPLHARFELNNQATPNTPDLRANLYAQYDNLWDLEHQVGIQYSFTPEYFKNSGPYNVTPFDDPQIANYSVYYRMPLGGYNSVQEQVDANPGSFGYNEITHQFQMPPPTGRPELTVYAARSTSDTGIQFGPRQIIIETNLVGIGHRTAGENVTLNEGLGFKFSLPLPALDKLVSTLTFGADYKNYQAESANADIFYELVSTTNNSSAVKFGHVLYSLQQPVRLTTVDYFPLNAGWSGSVPDSQGTTFINAQANFNLPDFCSDDKDANFSRASYTTNAHADYITLQAGATRIQTIYKDWSVKFHADGQWANGPLINNEQYAMGGVAGVRGYTDGEAYGDTGWRFSIEPQTPLIKIGMIGNEGREEPCWVRSSVFLDIGRTYLLEPAAGARGYQSFCGVGWGITANLGSRMDMRLTTACPLISTPLTRAGDVHIYFGVGAQF